MPEVRKETIRQTHAEQSQISRIIIDREKNTSVRPKLNGKVQLKEKTSEIQNNPVRKMSRYRPGTPVNVTNKKHGIHGVRKGWGI